MVAYRAKFEEGRIIPIGDYLIPEGSELIITVLDNTDKTNEFEVVSDEEFKKISDKILEQNREAFEVLAR